MYISDCHDYSPEPSDTLKEFIAKGRKEQIKRVIEELVEDEFANLQDYGDEYISQVAARRAEQFLERVLKGDDDAAMSLLGDRHDGSRYRQTACELGKPWAHLIHGRLFEAGGLALRRQVVEANVDLIQNERIKDLESIVEGLMQQVRGLESDLERCRERL